MTVPSGPIFINISDMFMDVELLGSAIIYIHTVSAGYHRDLNNI